MARMGCGRWLSGANSLGISSLRSSRSNASCFGDDSTWQSPSASFKGFSKTRNGWKPATCHKWDHFIKKRLFKILLLVVTNFPQTKMSMYTVGDKPWKQSTRESCAPRIPARKGLARPKYNLLVLKVQLYFKPKLVYCGVYARKKILSRNISCLYTCEKAAMKYVATERDVNRRVICDKTL